MAEYLSKEEIKQWRSSLEKITLEEFAARLGKIVADSRPTNDLVDMVMNGSTSSDTQNRRTTSISNIEERAFARERQLSHTPFSVKAPVEQNNIVENSENKIVSEQKNDIVEKILKRQEKEQIKEEAIIKESASEKLRDEVSIVLKKNLTDREQLVFDYLLNHRNTTVYAKDLAALLDLPRDYIYKYIKNLRAKIEGDKLVNAERGGFVLLD